MKNMKNLIKIAVGIMLTSLIFTLNAQSQTKFISKNGFISFYSHTPIEDITAENNQVLCMFSTDGELSISLLMRAFKFKIALMEEHFNENYVESEKYPKATFKGKVENISEVNFSANGEYKVKAKGDLTIHGITNAIDVEGVIVVQNNTPRIKANFNVKPVDYKINIPSMAKEKIAESIVVTVDIPLSAGK